MRRRTAILMIIGGLLGGLLLAAIAALIAYGDGMGSLGHNHTMADSRSADLEAKLLFAVAFFGGGGLVIKGIVGLARPERR
jgi:hypothetical protein